jgi:hypothetical protein
MATDNDNNLLVAVDGDQAVIGTDIYSSAGLTAHAQVMKVAWGNDATVTRATTTTPLPVQVFGLTGTLATVTVTGAVRGLGVFTIGNTAGSPVHVTGGVNAFVYGVAGATPVTVTGSVNINAPVGITGTVNVTGGRYLNSTTDSILVGGTVARNWNLTNATDNIKVYAPDGGATFSVKIVGAGGTVIGSSGDALNVNMVNAGISANITIGSTINVQNAAGTVMRIEGTAGGTPVPVSGTVSLASSAIEVINSVLPVDIQPTQLNLAGNPQFPTAAKNIEKLLMYYEGGYAYSIPWYLRELRYDLSWNGPTGSVAKRLNELVTNGSSNRQAPFEGVRTFNSTTNTIKTYNITLTTAPVILDSVGASQSIKHGVTIKNTSGDTSIVLGSAINNPAVSVINWSAPNADVYYGIHLSPGESIFIPNSISTPNSSGNFPIASVPPPLYGKIISGPSSTVNLYIMAV